MAVELLAPVGSPASLKAAVEAGADSVYFGSKWNARMRARNFSSEELACAITYCHREGVKAYVALNTVLFENELNGVAEHVAFAYEYGADALIVQDLGAARIAREVAPELPLHASTQLSVHNSKSASILKQLGFERIILARELSLEQVKKIKENAGVEVEVFCHGALCYSYSGKCLLSAFQTGRSGNRGACAQLCRLPWKFECGGRIVREGYLTSTKDLNVIGRIPEIQEAGVDCVKIEGRLKDAVYVRRIVKAYREAIDEWETSGKIGRERVEAIDLSKLTSRGYTEGYLFGKAREEKWTNPKATSFAGVKVGVVLGVSSAGARVELNAPLKVGDAVRSSSSGKVIEVFRMYERKNGREKEVKFSSTTCYLKIKTLHKGDVLSKVERAHVEDDFLQKIIPDKEKKAKEFTLQRTSLAFEKLPEIFFSENKGSVFEAPAGSACTIALEDADEKILEAAEKRGLKAIIETPRVVFDEELKEVGEKMKEVDERGVFAFMSSEPSLASSYSTIVSPYANVCNSLAALEWKSFSSVKGVIAGFEVPRESALTLGFVPFTSKNVELMISENNLFKELGLEERKDCFLVDPRGNKFRVKIKNWRTIVMAPKK